MNIQDQSGHEHSGPGYDSPPAAREQRREKVLYVAALYEGPGSPAPISSRRWTWVQCSSSYPEIHLPGADWTTELFQ